MDDITCLSQAVYYEARGESRQGQEAVAYVVLNRGGKICSTVYKGCQFSWTCRVRTAPYGRAWIEAQEVAQTVLRERNDFTGGATHFHSVTVKPSWAYKFRLTMQIGNHLFYRGY